jgi:hypothetical protein
MTRAAQKSGVGTMPWAVTENRIAHASAVNKERFSNVASDTNKNLAIPM